MNIIESYCPALVKTEKSNRAPAPDLFFLIPSLDFARAKFADSDQGPLLHSSFVVKRNF